VEPVRARAVKSGPGRGRGRSCGSGSAGERAVAEVRIDRGLHARVEEGQALLARAIDDLRSALAQIEDILGDLEQHVPGLVKA